MCLGAIFLHNIKEMRKPVYIWILVIVGLLVAIAIAGMSVKGKNSSTLNSTPNVIAKKGMFKVSINELGVFESEKKKSILPPFRGKVLKMVQDGTHVEKGQTVIWLDTDDITDDLESQITQLKSVKMDLDSSIASLLDSIKNNTVDAESAEAELDFNRLQLQEVNNRLETLEILNEHSLVPGRDIDDAERNVEAAKLAARSSDFTYKEKIEQLYAEEKINRRKLKDIDTKGKLSQSKITEHLDKLEHAEIKAPETGIFVLTKHWSWRNRKMVTVQEGDNVHPRRVIAEIPDLNSLIIKTQVSEADISKVSVGMNVVLSLDAFEGRQIEGNLTRIGRVAIDRSQSPAGELATEEQQEIMQKVFEVTVKPAETDSRIRPGMTAEVSFIIEEIPDAVYVPLDCVFNKHGKTYVFKNIDGKQYEKVEVDVGNKNKDSVIIEKGVAPGDTLFTVDLDEKA